MLGESGDEAGEPCAQLFHRGTLLDVGERHEAEVARREHDHVGLRRLVGPARSGEFVVVGRPEHDVTVDHPVARRGGEQLADTAVLVAHRFGERAVQVAPPLRRHLGHGDVDIGIDQ